MRWRITGIVNETGLALSKSIEADSANHASDIAASQGIRIESIRLEELPLLNYRSSPPAIPAGKIGPAAWSAIIFFVGLLLIFVGTILVRFLSDPTVPNDMKLFAVIFTGNILLVILMFFIVRMAIRSAIRQLDREGFLNRKE